MPYVECAQSLRWAGADLVMTYGARRLAVALTYRRCGVNDEPDAVRRAQHAANEAGFAMSCADRTRVLATLAAGKPDGRSWNWAPAPVWAQRGCWPA